MSSKAHARPRSVRLTLLGVVAAIALTACLAPAVTVTRADSVIADLIQRHQAVREPDFQVSSSMSSYAQYHAERLAKNSACSTSHSPELGQWYAGYTAAENVVCWAQPTGCPSDGKVLMDAWLNSPTHRSHIFDTRCTWLGVGAACGGGKIVAVAQYRSP